MTGGVLGRLVSMDRAQATFRLRGELCKLRERARLAWSPSRWDRTHLAAGMRNVPDAPHWNLARQAMARGDHHAAHCALARHFAERTSAFPLDPRDIPTLAARISAHFPGAADDAARRAREIAAGRYTLLGHRDVRVGFPIDWHRDPVYGRRVPRVHWAAVPYLDPTFGDHKVIWELNRHQHWLAFGRAFALTGNRVHYDAFRSQLRSWLDANPPLTGTNWASMLELAIRVLSWLWALSFFSAVAQHDSRDEPPWMVDALLAIAQQLTHVERNLSLYFSPNTHLSGEALALYVAGCTLPELAPSTRWANRGREVLLQEARAQVCEDGGHAERSTHYHRYSTDFYLLALDVARRSGDGAGETFERTALAQAVYLRTITNDDGRRPAIGDDDGGQMFPICGPDPEDCRDTLAVAAVLLESVRARRRARARGSILGLWRTSRRARQRTPCGVAISRLVELRLFRIANPNRRSLAPRRGTTRLPQRRARPRRRAVSRTDSPRPSVADRPGHGHVHDGSRRQRQVPRNGDAQHPDAGSPAAMRALRAISVAVAGVGACARLVVRSRLRLRRR